MAEEIIDLRDRIEKMRFQIESEVTKQKSNQETIEIHHKMSNSNISMSLQNKVDDTRYNDNLEINSTKQNEALKDKKNEFDNKESFPSVSLSVKNPISSKLLVGMVGLQILSNIGILFFLYIGME